MTDSAFSLAQIQAWMQNALHAPETQDSGDIAARFVARDGFSGAAGLAVYQNSYLARIKSCMREQFPALCHALGQELFDDFVAEYIRAHPPTDYSLYGLGLHFPEYLANNSPDEDAGAVWIAFMIELASFERTVFQLFDAPGAENQCLADMDTLDEDLRLQPGMRLIACQFDLGRYYHAVREGLAPELPARAQTHFLLVRKDFVTRILPLSPHHFQFLETVKKGTTVPAALRDFAQAQSLTVEEVQTAWANPDGLRRNWIEAGVFTRHIEAA